MKTVFVGFFALFAFVVVANANFNQSPRINVTAKFQKKLKEITDKMPEPIELSDQNIQIEDLKVTISGAISGLKALACNDLQIGIIGGLSINNFEFVLPNMSMAITNYDLDGKLGIIPIYGKGQIDLHTDNIVLKGKAKLGITIIDGVQYAQITSMTANLSLDQDTFNFKITGWLNDEMRSEFLSNMINSFVQSLTPEAMKSANEQLSSILTALVADFKIPLADMTKP